MTKEQAQTRLRAILNEIVVSDDPRGIAVATLRDRIYIAANDLARACVAEALADPLVGYLMSDFGMKISAARLLARRVPKKAPDGRELTEEERILAVHRLYEKRGSE